MKIQLASFPAYSRLTKEKRHQRIDAIVKILNESPADFVMFSQWVLRDTEDLRIIRALVNNKSVSAFIELKEANGLNGNCMYIFQDGQWMYMDCQIFSESSDAKKYAIKYLLDDVRGNHFNMRRQFVAGGKRFLVINCGENNFLKGSSGIADFRFKDCCIDSLFEEVLDSIDVVLNPVHDRWSRFGHFLTRIRKFSEHNRYCFSNTQMEGSQFENALKSPDHNTTHVAMHNSEPLAPINTEVVDAGAEKVLLQTYEVL